MTAPDKSLESRILDWLQTQGYPLEMWVAGELEASGFRVALSDYYSDLKTQELREIDVTGFKVSSIQNGRARLRLCVRIECKLSKDKPWVVFMRDLMSQERIFPPDRTPMSERLSRIWYESSTLKDVTRTVRRLTESDPLAPYPNVGHSIIQVFKDSTKDGNVDAAYKAVTSAVNASIALIEADKSLTATNRSKNLLAAVPVIVIDARLFECVQHGDEQLALREVDSTAVQWKGVSQAGLSPVVHVCTRSGLANFITQTVQAHEKLVELANSTADLLSDPPPNKRLRLR